MITEIVRIPEYTADQFYDTTEPYAFTIYYNYDWWTIRPFGDDAASAEIEKRFNVDVTLTKPDSDPAAKLNLMVTSGDYPEVIYMDNNSDFRKLIGQGIFVPLSELKYEGNPYDEAFAQSSQNLIAVDGEVYSWPNWIRKGATGGNNTWQVLESVWNANEAPKFQTVEEMYDWLLKVKEAGGLKNAKGQEIAPFMTNNSASGSAILECFLRAQGRPNRPQDWWTQGQGGSEADYTFYLEDEYVIAALKEAKLVRKEFDGVKVLGNGEVTKKITVKATVFSATAKEKIEAAGGKTEVE